MLFNLFSKTSGFNVYLSPFSLALLKPAATGRATNWRVLFNGKRKTENGKLTMRSESRGCLHTMPSREEEKPAQQD